MPVSRQYGRAAPAGWRAAAVCIPLQLGMTSSARASRRGGCRWPARSPGRCRRSSRFPGGGAGGTAAAHGLPRGLCSPVSCGTGPRVRLRPGRPRCRAGRYPSAAVTAPGIGRVPGRQRAARASATVPAAAQAASTSSGGVMALPLKYSRLRKAGRAAPGSSAAPKWAYQGVIRLGPNGPPDAGTPTGMNSIPRATGASRPPQCAAAAVTHPHSPVGFPVAQDAEEAAFRVALGVRELSGAALPGAETVRWKRTSSLSGPYR